MQNSTSWLGNTVWSSCVLYASQACCRRRNGLCRKTKADQRSRHSPAPARRDWCSEDGRIGVHSRVLTLRACTPESPTRARDSASFELSLFFSGLRGTIATPDRRCASCYDRSMLQLSATQCNLSLAVPSRRRPLSITPRVGEVERAAYSPRATVHHFIQHSLRRASLVLLSRRCSSLSRTSFSTTTGTPLLLAPHPSSLPTQRMHPRRKAAAQRNGTL